MHYDVVQFILVSIQSIKLNKVWVFCSWNMDGKIWVDTWTRCLTEERAMPFTQQ